MRLALTLLILLPATPALAQSNMGLTQYPAPNCEKTASEAVRMPRLPPEDATPAQIGIYNAQLRAYNATLRARDSGKKSYGRCFQDYFSAGKADIQRIQIAIDAALAAANNRAPATPPMVPPQSNLEIAQYPAPKCEKPAANTMTRPEVPSNTLSVEQAAAYNAKVRAYNAAMTARGDDTVAYAGCMQDYIIAGTADIRRIQAAIDAAETRANAR